jgi:hypothetical protein
VARASAQPLREVRAPRALSTRARAREDREKASESSPPLSPSALPLSGGTYFVYVFDGDVSKEEGDFLGGYYATRLLEY